MPLWTPCALVFVSWCIYTAVLTLTCVLPTYQSALDAIPPPTHFQAGRKNHCSGTFVIFSPFAWAKLSHGGLVSDYSLASGDFLRWIAGVRKDHCLCHGRGNLSSICHFSPTPHPVPLFSGSGGLSAAVWSLSPSSHSRCPSHPAQRPPILLTPSPNLTA